MRRTEQAQGLRLMKFEEVYGRTRHGVLGQAEAAEILGVSERTFRRWRDRYEPEGTEGLYGRRLGRVSARRAPVDEVARVLELFDTRYWDFTAKHFHEKLVAEHGCERSCSWVRLSLQAHGCRRAAPRRGGHRRKRARRALPGMMVHQDGSRHEWLAGQPPLDLIVTMDDATSEIYSAFFVEEEGTMSSLRALAETAEAAAARLDEFEAGWSGRYPAIIPAWRRAPEHVVAMFAFPPAIRKMIYTTDALECLHRSLRKIIKTRGSFPSGEAAKQLLLLAIRNAGVHWRRPIEWTAAMGQFAILFEDRLPASAR